jgi:hypothetical protein
MRSQNLQAWMYTGKAYFCPPSWSRLCCLAQVVGATWLLTAPVCKLTHCKYYSKLWFKARFQQLWSLECLHSYLWNILEGGSYLICTSRLSSQNYAAWLSPWLSLRNHRHIRKSLIEAYRWIQMFCALQVSRTLSGCRQRYKLFILYYWGLEMAARGSCLYRTPQVFSDSKS